ncbi:MAG TPA: hypothetical protein VF384_08255 [Planctomycetota bacterium]
MRTLILAAIALLLLLVAIPFHGDSREGAATVDLAVGSTPGSEAVHDRDVGNRANLDRMLRRLDRSGKKSDREQIVAEARQRIHEFDPNAVDSLETQDNRGKTLKRTAMSIVN